MPNYYFPMNFDLMLLEAARRNQQTEIIRYERQRQNEIDRQALVTEERNQRTAVQTKRHKQKKIHAQAPKDVPAFLKNLTKHL